MEGWSDRTSSSALPGKFRVSSPGTFTAVISTILHHLSWHMCFCRKDRYGI
ncbi:hypothetical protein SISNIDRAFT_166338 [Sistotremastrum niveocremeum HHB9708]|uniref:Uncharacterized protein n=1 Tax=Sistotremastrum niveocremeum HHB9708 TaxID=1314777 RepID=A0A164S7F0_9AGAM|nr:hypothetical protein SISNIDRAFT_166338 [Sistotremastrum niveocremeum HHB9708]